MMQKPPAASPKFKLKLLYSLGLCLLVVIGLGMCGKDYLYAPLPRGAYPVLNTGRWLERRPQFMLSPKFCWLPNGDISYTETSVHGLPQICYQKMDASGPVGVVRYGPELSPGPMLCSAVPSPDEHWVAYSRMLSFGSFQTWVVSADGKAQCTVKELFMGWLADNQSFMSISFAPPQTSYKVHHLDRSAIETLPNPEGWSTPFVLTRLLDSPNFLMSGIFLQPMPGSDRTVNYPNMEMRIVQTAGHDIVPQAWTVSAPAATYGVAIASSDNSHLLWITSTRKPAPMDQWLHRLFPRRKVAIKNSSDYYISDLHGNHRRRILEGGLNRVENLYPTWTPDSKHLSFLYKDKLYLIPID